MIYKAETFDKFQYLYEVTKFSDHQLHCVISFEDNINSDIMGKALSSLLKVVPILSCAYRHNNRNSYWESINPSEFEEYFIVTENETYFNEFTTLKTNELVAPQIKVCLYKSNKDSISIILNHMICDAAGFKQCIYLLSSLYSKFLVNPSYRPEYKVDGDRNFKMVTAEIPLMDKIKCLLFQNKDNNQRSSFKFPMSTDKDTSPIIITYQISANRFIDLCKYCKNKNVTINDAVLAAYYRVITKMLGVEGEMLTIPIMIDMRRYLKDKSFKTLSNLTSTVITKITVNPDETFNETVYKVNHEMNIKKANYIGLNGFVKLDFATKIFTKKMSFQVIKKNIKNPYICTTNIGIIDSEKLVFQGSPVKDAYMCGSIKYRPHFQLALSSFANKMTFSVNLYASQQERDTIAKFLQQLDKEFPI